VENEVESDEEPLPDPGEPLARPDEVRAAARDLSDPAERRLIKAAKLFIRFHPQLSGRYEPRELLHMAVLAALAGDRKWRKTRVDFVKFLAEVMRSIAFNEARKLKGGDQPHLVSEQELQIPRSEGRGHSPLENIADPSPGPEDQLLNKEKDARIQTKLALVKAQLADDPEIAQIFELQRQGLSKRDIRQKLGMTDTQFWSADRKLARRIEQILERLKDNDS
jgi:hypothetical protein